MLSTALCPPRPSAQCLSLKCKPNHSVSLLMAVGGCLRTYLLSLADRPVGLSHCPPPWPPFPSPCPPAPCSSQCIRLSGTPGCSYHRAFADAAPSTQLPFRLSLPSVCPSHFSTLHPVFWGGPTLPDSSVAPCLALPAPVHCPSTVTQAMVSLSLPLTNRKATEPVPGPCLSGLPLPSQTWPMVDTWKRSAK